MGFVHDDRPGKRPMRPFIVRLATTAGLLMVLIAPAGADETLQQRSERSFDGAGIESVRVENARGRVTVTRSTDGRVHLTATKIVRTGDRERSERIAAETDVTAGVSDRVLDVRVRYPKRSAVRVNFWDLLRGYEMPRAEVRLTLQVPDRIETRVRTASGDVRTEDLRGPQVLNSSSGDMTIVGARGPVEARSSSGDIEAAELARARLRTSSGDVRVRDVSGPLRANTTSGDLRVTGAKDSLGLGTVSGNVRVTGAPKGIRVNASSGRVVVHEAARSAMIETSSGDVDLEIVGRLERVDVRTGSGAIRAWMSGVRGCDLDLTTSSGRLDVALPVKLQQATRHRLRGVIGDGSASVTLKTSSGDIDVRGKRI